VFTTSEGERLAAWVQDTGKRPHAIFVTHGHADHFFGAGPVLDAFPDAQLMACDQQVVDEGAWPDHPQSHGELELPVRRAVFANPLWCPP
jgi:glyoxylase-like metal-dependent hydrolase (beta-lactamase superfamily II)